MELVRDAVSDRQFDGFAAEVSDTLFRTGYLMTGDAGEAEDLVQETFLRVARRWNRVRAMDHPAAYARRILINLVLHSADRRSRQKAELVPEGAWSDAADLSAARVLREIDDLAEFRWAWRSCLRVSGPCWFCGTGLTCLSPKSPASWAAPPGRSRAPHRGLPPG